MVKYNNYISDKLNRQPTSTHHSLCITIKLNSSSSLAPLRVELAQRLKKREKKATLEGVAPGSDQDLLMDFPLFDTEVVEVLETVETTTTV